WPRGTRCWPWGAPSPGCCGDPSNTSRGSRWACRGGPCSGGTPARGSSTDWGSRPHIARGGQDGTPPVPLVTEGVERPQGLALDQSSQRLYWADGRLHSVSSVALDGSGRRTHLRDPQHLGQPLGLAVFQGWAVWTDPPRGAVVAARLGGGSEGGSPLPPRVVAQELFSPEAVVVLHPGTQPPGPNRCEGRGSLLLPLPPLPTRDPRAPVPLRLPRRERLDSDGFTCVTAPNTLDGERLDSDGFTCVTDPRELQRDHHEQLSRGGDRPSESPQTS
ncbi:low-density lipoprotein receptor 2-like, partial [Myiozetetes cayanensis]|uniref:low-density lipoprotein receptor 2-like n=1 Tax=Myiozetetes cayanensis TaxID=478635 RepID=UPI0021601954